MKRQLLAIAAVLFAVMTTLAALPEPGVYKIQNVYSGTYVKLQGTYLADITALTADDASDLLVEYGKRNAAGEAVLTTLSGDGGDMIETLAFIKGLIKEVLEYENQPTDFLDAMFELHLVPTGDADGSVFLTVDVPEIDNWDTIRDIILEYAAGQTAVTYYISHMHPGNRHYMGIDYDGSFGYRLQAGSEEGTDIKWLMYTMDYPTTAYYFMRNLNSQQSINVTAEDYAKVNLDLADRHTAAGAVVKLNIAADGSIDNARSQGVEVAQALESLRGQLLQVAKSFVNGDEAKAQAIVDEFAIRLNRTNVAATGSDRFVYDAFRIKLHIPAATELNGIALLWPLAKTNLLGKLQEELGADSRVYQAIAARADLLELDADIYLVQDADGTLGLAGYDELNALGNAAKWQLDLIDTEDNYFAAAPEVSADGKYYTTLYTDFPYTVVDPDATHVYAVTAVAADGTPTLADLGTTIPAQTGVLIECDSQDAAEHLLLPILDNTAAPAPRRDEAAGTNLLQGTFFDDTVANDPEHMAVLAEGLKFVASADNFMAGNKAWATIEKKPTAITAIQADDNAGEPVIYDLMGRRVTAMQHGIYIVNGRKVCR